GHLSLVVSLVPPVRFSPPPPRCVIPRSAALTHSVRGGLARRGIYSRRERVFGRPTLPTRASRVQQLLRPPGRIALGAEVELALVEAVGAAVPELDAVR